MQKRNFSQSKNYAHTEPIDPLKAIKMSAISAKSGNKSNRLILNNVKSEVRFKGNDFSPARDYTESPHSQASAVLKSITATMDQYKGSNFSTLSKTNTNFPQSSTRSGNLKAQKHSASLSKFNKNAHKLAQTASLDKMANRSRAQLKDLKTKQFSSVAHTPSLQNSPERLQKSTFSTAERFSTTELMDKIKMNSTGQIPPIKREIKLPPNLFNNFPLSKLTARENESISSRLQALSKHDFKQTRALKFSNKDVCQEVKYLERINQKNDLMQATKKEMTQAMCTLNKLIIKREQFRTLHSQIGNSIDLKANEPVYLRLFVNQKPAPINFIIQKMRNEQPLYIYKSRTNNMPDADSYDQEYHNQLKFTVQQKHEYVFYIQYIYFSVQSPQDGQIIIYACFNKEKPLLNKTEFDGIISLKEDKKRVQKYQYVHRLKEILNDEQECEDFLRVAAKIKRKRLKEILQKAQSTRSHHDVNKYQEFLSQKPEDIPLVDFKHEKALERKQQQEEEQFKRNLFLLNRQELLKVFKDRAMKEAEEKKKMKTLKKFWYSLILNRELLQTMLQKFTHEKQQKLITQKKTNVARVVDVRFRHHIRKFGKDRSIRFQKLIKNALTYHAGVVKPVLEERVQKTMLLFLKDTTDQNRIIKRFQWYVQKVLTVQALFRHKLNQQHSRQTLLCQKWDSCLDELKNEYIIDKNEKDKNSQNIFRSLKLLGDEAKKRQIKTYFQKCQAEFEKVYSKWRTMRKEYFAQFKDSSDMQKNNIVRMFKKSVSIKGKDSQGFPEEEEPELKQAPKSTMKKGTEKGKGKDKKKTDLVEFYLSKYGYFEMDPDKEVEKLYADAIVDDIYEPPKFRFLPQAYLIKCLILKYKATIDAKRNLSNQIYDSKHTTSPNTHRKGDQNLERSVPPPQTQQIQIIQKYQYQDHMSPRLNKLPSDPFEQYSNKKSATHFPKIVSKNIIAPDPQLKHEESFGSKLSGNQKYRKGQNHPKLMSQGISSQSSPLKTRLKDNQAPTFQTLMIMPPDNDNRRTSPIRKAVRIKCNSSQRQGVYENAIHQDHKSHSLEPSYQQTQFINNLHLISNKQINISVDSKEHSEMYIQNSKRVTQLKNKLQSRKIMQALEQMNSNSILDSDSVMRLLYQGRTGPLTNMYTNQRSVLGYINNKYDDLSAETQDLKSKVQQNSKVMQNQTIKRSSPEQTVAHEIKKRKTNGASSSKSQKPYKLIGQNHGELLPLSGPQIPIDPKGQFFVVPNITYDSQFSNGLIIHQRPENKKDNGQTRNSLLQGVLATRKEQKELKKELQVLSKNASHTKVADKDALAKNVIVRGDKIMYESFQYISQLNQASIKVSKGAIKANQQLLSAYGVNPEEIYQQQQELSTKSMYGLSISNEVQQMINQSIGESYIEAYKKDNQTPRGSPQKKPIIRENNTSPKNSKLQVQLQPVPKIKIYHTDYSHHNNHPINQAINKINHVIRLIFKSHKEQSQTNGQQSMGPPQVVIEEAKFLEIQKLSKSFGIQIPKKFDSKTALKEYFTSKDFITVLKTKMNGLLHSAINDANQMTDILQLIQSTTSSGPYLSQKFYVGKGNNYPIVRNVIKQRYWWTLAQEEDFEEVNFMWTSWKKSKHIDYLQQRGSNSFEKGIKIYNRMQQNKQLTNKKGVFINMRDYYQATGEDPFSVLPFTFLVKNGLEDAEFRRFQEYFNDLDIQIKLTQQQRENALKERQKELVSLKKHQKSKKVLIPKKRVHHSDDEEDEEEEEDHESEKSDEEVDEKIREIKSKYRVPKNVWIIKPGENTNRGNGINVSSNMNEIKQLITRAASSPLTKDRTFIIQKYIDYPLLVHKRKFDFRCYGMLTSINGHMKGYFYEDGYIRTSCKEYDINNLDNKFIHLTNDAIQKNCDDYGKFENGNKMSLQDFQKYLRNKYPELQIDVWKHLMPQIKKLVTDTFRTAYGKIDPAKLHNTFELFGYDFMLDEDFRLYLIEVNTNPCLEMTCPLLCRIIPEVLDNAFRVVLDPIFPSPDLSSNRKYSINEIPQEVKFTLVFDDAIDGPVLDKLGKHSSEDIESDEEEALAQDDETQDKEIVDGEEDEGVPEEEEEQ